MGMRRSLDNAMVRMKDWLSQGLTPRQLAVTLAGFTPGESDELRRAIGAWRSSGDIAKVGRRLMDGLLQSGLPQEFVELVRS